MEATIKIKRISGQAYAEYVVGLMVVVVMLLTPVPGDAKGRGAVVMLMDAFKDNYAGYAYGMAIPE